ncbi:MAG: hydantoinase/oxoprolinase family protein [Betaproteobacteria bacterium]
MRGTMLSVAVDIGGTFTDVVSRDESGRLHYFKVPTTRKDESVAVLESIEQILAEWGVQAGAIGRFAHGTTVATNAVLERRGAVMGLITTAGFRDVLEIGRQMRHQMYDLILKPETPGFLAPGARRLEVTERIDAAGNVLVPIDEDGVRSAARALVDQGVESIAICFLFSFANPTHERRARAIIEAEYPELFVAVSHEVDPAFREYERTVVTAFDAYVKPVIGRYLSRLEQGLARSGVGAPLQVMQSRGGLMASPIARRRPVRLFLSGPAAGVIGARIAGGTAGATDLITVDIGGTSCDIALISKGKALVRADGVVDGYPIRVPMVDVNSIGAGGGSIAWLDAAGGLRVGPKSAGSEPGPACYGRGGTLPTVTDASVVLGYIDPAYFAGGTLPLEPALAERAILGSIAQPLGLSLHEAALGIHRVLNAQMAEGIRLVSIRQGLDPRQFVLLPLGGGGALHATALARDLAIRRIVVPRYPGVLSAAGLLAAPVEHEVSAAFGRPLVGVRIAEIGNALDDLDQQAATLMAQAALGGATITQHYFADVCYIGQAYTIEVPLEVADTAPLERLYADFLELHARIYGHSTRTPARIVNLRSVHQAGGLDRLDEHAYEAAAGDPAKGIREVLVAGYPDFVSAKVFDRAAMTAGFTLRGPAIVEQPDTTTLVEPGWRGHVDGAGNLILETEEVASHGQD